MTPRRLVICALAALALIPGGAARAQTTPALTATAQGDGPIDQTSMQDTATLSGSDAATGTITFSLFGPDDPDCLAPPLATSTANVAGDGRYASDPTWPDATGTYTYVASYGGDAGNAAVATTCGDPGQSVTIDPATPTLVTTATSKGVTGQPIDDSARLSGFSPTGSVTFSVYGPDDPTCAQPLATSSATVNGGDRLTSAPFVPSQPGVYRWIAAYDGDARNAPVAGACGDDGESTNVSTASPDPRTTPELGIRASQTVIVGGQIGATVTVATHGAALGTLTILLYGPDDDACQHGAIKTTTHRLATDGSYASDPYTPTAPGVYRFVARYDGPTSGARTHCDDRAAAVTVSPRPVPQLDRSFAVIPVSGHVEVKVPRGAAAAAAHASTLGFVEIHDERLVPMGTAVDTQRGVARLRAAGRGRSFQTGTFDGSRFVVHQRARDNGQVQLDARLSAAALRGCRQGYGRAHAAKRRKRRPQVINRLHAIVHGNFESLGQHSATAAHGTEWQIFERCDGTLTHVISDVVTVTDFGLNRTIRLRAGQSHLARARP